jgi:hypothetical protein
MKDLSNRPYVVALCHKLSNDRFHKQNLETIDSWIIIRKAAGQVDWDMVRQMCRDLIRRTIEAHYKGRAGYFYLHDKIHMADMAENMVEYFKSRHGEK